MNLNILLLVIFLSTANQIFGQNGRIDTLITKNENYTYYLKNNIDSIGKWSVEVIQKIDNKSDTVLELSNKIEEINHKKYENFFLEIKDGKSCQFLIDEKSGKRYYIYTDVYAEPKNGINNYTKCLYSNIEYSAKAKKKNIEGLAVMRIYINDEGCIDKVKPLSKLGYGIESATKRSMETCDCEFFPSKRNDEYVNTIWIMPMRFKLIKKENNR